MQVSSESDFELFAQKVKEHTRTAIKKIENEASEYVIQSEKKVSEELEKYSQEALSQWKEEYHVREQQEYKNIENSISRKWNAFKLESENRLFQHLEQRLEEIFPSLAQAFIECLVNKYETGTLIVPKPYMSFVKVEKFTLVESKDESVIFKSGNLYIEYSAERIMEELHNETASSMSFEENLWQV